MMGQDINSHLLQPIRPSQLLAVPRGDGSAHVTKPHDLLLKGACWELLDCGSSGGVHRSKCL